MGNEHIAAETCRRLMVKLDGIEAAAEMLELSSDAKGAIAGEVCRRLAKDMEGLREAAEILDKMGSIKTSIEEAVTDKNKAVAERDKLLREAEAARTLIVKAEGEAADIKTKGKEQARKVIELANLEAGTILNSAREAKNQEVIAIEATHKARMEELHKNIVEAVDGLGALNAKIKKAQTEAAVSEKERAVAASNLQAVKSQIQNLMGATK